MANFILLSTPMLGSSFSAYRVAIIDGAKTPTLATFYQAIEKGLGFPEDFEHDLESLDEFLNDLEWISASDVAIFIKNSDGFLAQEKPKKIFELLNLLDATAEDWKWVDDDMEPKNVKIVFQTSERIASLLDEEGIAYVAQ